MKNKTKLKFAGEQEFYELCNVAVVTTWSGIWREGILLSSHTVICREWPKFCELHANFGVKG